MGEGHPTVVTASLGLLPSDLPLSSGMITIPLLELLESPPHNSILSPHVTWSLLFSSVQTQLNHTLSLTALPMCLVVTICILAT